VAVIAILVFIAEIGSGQQVNTAQQTGLSPTFLLALFGFILSIIGLRVVVSLTLGYDHYIGDITMILHYWDKMEFYRRPKKPVTFRKVHRRFFEVNISLFAMLSLYYGAQQMSFLAVFHEHLILPVLAFFITFVVIEVLHQCRWERFSRECVQFKKALQYDFDGKYREEWNWWFKDPRHGSTTIRPEEIRERIIDDAVDREILSPDDVCWLCVNLDQIYRKLYWIYHRFYRVMYRRSRRRVLAKRKPRKL
jgi:hypothetical protein